MNNEKNQTKVSVKVRRGDGSIVEYIKPAHCPISDDIWNSSLGYCWGFALRQDEGLPQCTEDCGVYEIENTKEIKTLNKEEGL